MIKESRGEQETLAFGKQMGMSAQPGEIYLLDGDLGVGKTVFTKGFAEGLGISEPVTSPTFTLIQEYGEGRIPFYHFDVYRIADVEEMEEIGYEDCFFGDGVCMVEWAEQIRGLIPESAVWICIEKVLAEGFDCRRITVKGNRL